MLYQSSNASGTTNTTMTMVEDGVSSIGSNSILGNGLIPEFDNDDDDDGEEEEEAIVLDGTNKQHHNLLSNRNSTYSSRQGSQSLLNGGGGSLNNGVEKMRQTGLINNLEETVVHRIYNYRKRKFIDYEHRPDAVCEEICLDFARDLMIRPNTRYLFGLRSMHSKNTNNNNNNNNNNNDPMDNNKYPTTWLLPGQRLEPGIIYCFRIRFKVPSIDIHLQCMDPESYEYLYNQMRYDVVHECIPEIRYPQKKDNVMGLGAVNMYIDLLEERDTAEHIENNYKQYLPRPLLKAHKIFGKRKICKTFRGLRQIEHKLGHVKWIYIHEVTKLAPDYMIEMFVGTVDSIPGIKRCTASKDGSAIINCPEIKVWIRLDLLDSNEPGLKVARLAQKEKMEWYLISKLENIYALYAKSNDNNQHSCRLEITGMPNGYNIQFNEKSQLQSFISYISGYTRLTTKWTVDLCVQYPTPSITELMSLRCHGPIGGAFSFAKIRERRDICGSYIIRQCEKKYDTYYIDINTQTYRGGLQPEKFKTETFKITRKTFYRTPTTSTSTYASTSSSSGNGGDYNNSNNNNNITIVMKWILHTNGTRKIFDKLSELAQSIPTENDQRFLIPPSEYDKSPFLLLCTPKKLLMKKNENELSDAELQRKRVQIFDPPKDLQWYQNSCRDCSNGQMIQMRADWIQEGGFKDVSVTLKVLKRDNDFQKFMTLANTWSRIYSPHIIKLYGFTLTTPYTMVMEYMRFGPLNEFLSQHRSKVSLRQLLDVVHGLVRGIVYLQEHDIVHGFIRCANLCVTKFDPKSHILEAKISDPGFPRPYRKDELAWIPFEYHNNLCTTKKSYDIDLWAFATTVWEIFARGKTIGTVTSEFLRQNYNNCGGILPVPSDDCPYEMTQVMMDGWSMEPEKNFNHMQIFQRLIFVKENLNDDYTTIDYQDDAMADQDSSYDTNNELNEDLMKENGFSVDQQNNNNKKMNYRSYFDTTPSVLEIKNGKVIFKEKIGEGHYGTVHLGEVRYNSPGNARELVAIKTLKAIKAPKLNDDFMREIEIMETLDHPNIVKIKHWIQKPFCIIMEYLEGGSFLVYLKSRKPNLTNQILLGFALDIARGMDYLVNKNIIHRDLAARNILVHADNVVKISDFGLAQRADSDGYYIAHTNREIPIKWYSPEAIRKDAKFSSQSDVWSYGVTLFEMFSRGESPNLDPDRELSQDEFLKRLENGDRLRKPHLCPDEIYEKLLKQCWHANPKLRPTFSEIIDIIKTLQANEFNN